MIWVGVAAFFAKNSKRPVLVNGEMVERYSWAVALIAIIPLIYLAGNRGMIADTWANVYAFEQLPNYSLDQKDAGFRIFGSVIKQFISSDWRVYLFIIAAIQLICLTSVYRKYSTYFFWSLFLFVASSDYFAWMFNGIRQFLAATIAFLALPFIVKKKYVPAIIIILLASTIHKSALILLPALFIVVGKAWNKRTLIFVLLLVVIIVFIGQFTTILDSSLADTQYKNVVRDTNDMNDDGTHPLRVLFYSLPTIIAFVGRKKLKVVDDPLIHVCVNMSLISSGLYLISMFMGGVIFGRIPIYMSLYNYILIPWEIDNIIPERHRRNAWILLFFLYIAFYYYQMSITNGVF